MKIEHVAFQVADPAAMADWYVKHLGFRVRRSSDEPVVGRFIADAHSCLWIEWKGAVKRRWFYHNGSLADAIAHGPNEMAWTGHRLRLDSGATLRTGCVTDTAFRGAPGLRRLLPRAVRGIEETKWCSRGVLTDPIGGEHAGWAIHEVAHFPQDRDR